MWDPYLEEQEDKKRRTRLRHTSNRNLPKTILWLLEKDWKLLLSKNLYLIFDCGKVFTTIKLDKNIHVDMVDTTSWPWIYHDCPNITLWGFLRSNLINNLMSNYNYLYFVKGSKMVIINCGNMTAAFLDNVSGNSKLYHGWDVQVSEDKLSVNDRPVKIEKKFLRVKEGYSYITKEDLEKIPLSSVWIKESRKFGE